VAPNSLLTDPGSLDLASSSTASPQCARPVPVRWSGVLPTHWDNFEKPFEAGPGTSTGTGGLLNLRLSAIAAGPHRPTASPASTGSMKRLAVARAESRSRSSRTDAPRAAVAYPRRQSEASGTTTRSGMARARHRNSEGSALTSALFSLGGWEIPKTVVQVKVYGVAAGFVSGGYRARSGRSRLRRSSTPLRRPNQPPTGSPNVRSGKMIGRQLSCCRYRAVEATAVVATQSQYRRQHPQEVWT